MFTRYAYEKNRKGDGYTVWTIGLSGSKGDPVGNARCKRSAQALVNRLYAKLSDKPSTVAGLI